MGVKTGVAWASATWNPWQGCTKVSRGCQNCYMYREKTRYGQDPTRVVRSKRATFRLPLAKRQDGSWKIPSGSRVFVCSWSDFFHKDADEWRIEALEIMAARPDLSFLIPTKRPKRIKDALWGKHGGGYLGGGDYLANVWLGVSVEDKDSLHRVGELLALDWPGVTWVSLEPLIGPVSIREYLGNYAEGRATIESPFRIRKGISWVVVGAESGPGAQSMDPNWVRRIRDDCQKAGAPLFVKQLHIDGRLVKDIAEFPEDLRIREFPQNGQEMQDTTKS